MSTRRFLFLQGVNTPFFAKLADKLQAEGHVTYRINFSAGDVMYWGRRDAWAFRKPLPLLKEFLSEKLSQHGITDILLFGDRRPIHQPAVILAKKLGIRVHVFEEGYLRPYWVTLERNGVNAGSLLPRDANWLRLAAKRVPSYGDGEPFLSTLRVRALHDMAYHSFNFWNFLFFPRYRTHRPLVSAIEYIGWGRRFSLMPWYERSDHKTISALFANQAPFYLLPLQLDSDTQIREHSPFDHMEEVINLTMSSFARCAPAGARLVIKNHPLDTGFVNYRRIIRRLEKKLDMRGRVDYLESGDLDPLIKKAQGLVTVNSTVGLTSLALGCPTIALSDPIYNLEGLTFRGSLDEFWQMRTSPDADLFNAFRNVLIHTTQINGGFYSSEGIAMAVTNSAKVLLAEQSPLELLQ
jgi:capsular polysaccharide export protein